MEMVEDDIRRNRRSVLCIGDASPARAYTIGNAIGGLPELLMIGEGVCGRDWPPQSPHSYSCCCPFIEGFCNVSGSLDRARPPDRIGFCNGPGCAVNVLDDLSQTMIERGSAFADGELVKLGGKYPFKIIDADQRAHDEYTIQAGQYHDTEDYRVQQVLIPDRNGRYPDDPECQQPYATVPVLGHRRH
jgi:hypothetical protein